ncbi:MAG: protein kinase [Anaerolineaceae bacterium]|nr:protein kinase [Anaerolineaceae bacterium]
MPLQINNLILERYKIIKVLGHGGMSSVYMAFDENIQIPVAIKENLVLSENFSIQFKKEATILATLRHPNLPRVSDYFHIPGQGQYLVMDYIDGEDLRERIEREENLSEKEVIIIGLLICDALMYLHNLSPKVIHRDIKPGNIRITPEGNIILVDFGLVKVMDIDQNTATGARAMTPGYSPPEQYGRGTTDERSDVYSLGATLYAALTGLIPEESLNRLSGKEKLTPISKHRKAISEKFDKVIQKALEIDPENRFQSAEDLYMALLDAGNFMISSKNIGLISPPPLHKISTPIKTGVSQPLIKPFSINTPEKNRYSKIILFPLLLIISIIMFFGITNADNIYAYVFGNKDNQTNNSSFVSTQPTEIMSNTPKKEITSSLPINSNAEEATPTPPKSGIIGGGTGEIAYSSNYQDQGMQIWIMTIDGLVTQKLTSLEDGACQPDWSPDGTKLVFISPCNAKKEIYEGARLFILDLSANKEIYPLPIPVDPSGDFDPVWSPDGSQIAFSSLRPGNDPITKERMIHIFIYNFQSESISEITDSRWRDRNPAWSNDGNNISFVRKIADNEVWILDLEKSEEYQFASKGNVNLNYPNWSKNDQILFFTHQNISSGSLPYFVGKRIEDAGVNVEFRIPPSGQQSFSPSVDSVISPDGQWFVFESWPDGINHDIYIATINGANLTQLTFEKSFEFSPDWRP